MLTIWKMAIFLAFARKVFPQHIIFTNAVIDNTPIIDVGEYS